MLAQREYHVLLADIMMPKVSGLEILPLVVSAYPKMAVIMVSAVIDAATAIAAMRDGAWDYVTKPINFDELIARIETAIEKRKQVVENLHYREIFKGKRRRETEG
jgi:DNA-binding NtrC family response regulator